MINIDYGVVQLCCHPNKYRDISILYQVYDFDFVDRPCNGDLKPLMKGEDMCGTDNVFARSFKCVTCTWKNKIPYPMTHINRLQH